MGRCARPMLLHDLLRRSASARPDSAALIFGEERVSYWELTSRANTLAAALQRRGVERGARVLTLIDNSIEAVVAIWGILLAGAVVVPVGPSIRPMRLRYIINDCSPAAIVAAPDLASVIDQAASDATLTSLVCWTMPPKGRRHELSLAAIFDDGPAEPGEVGQIDQDLAAIIYTSGTTGESKGVMLTHRNIVNTTGVISGYLANHRDDIVCCILPLWFSYGLFQIFSAPVTGYCVLIEKSFAFPYDVLKRVQRHRATGLPGVPSAFARLLRMLPLDGIDLGSLRYMTNAAAGIPPAHVLALREAFPGVDFFSMYGQTECTRAVFLDPKLAVAHPDSVGRAMPNCEIYVIDEHGRRITPGQIGELVVRGTNVMRGYWGKPAETGARLRDGEIPGEKVLHTGDLFRTDASGLFYFVARTDDIFKCRGEKVAPLAIENVLYELPEVAEAAVVGVEDQNDGLAVKAFVVPREGIALTEAAIRKHCHLRLDAVMVPRYVELVATLPKTESGKLRRAGLSAKKA
jgi:long-chain acyl-CoA synthetase